MFIHVDINSKCPALCCFLSWLSIVCVTCFGSWFHLLWYHLNCYLSHFSLRNKILVFEMILGFRVFYVVKLIWSFSRHHFPTLLEAVYYLSRAGSWSNHTTTVLVAIHSTSIFVSFFVNNFDPSHAFLWLLSVLLPLWETWKSGSWM